MSHELSFYEGKAEMFYYERGGLPWHGLGQPVDKAPNAAEAIAAAHLDWHVEKRALFYQGDDGEMRRAQVGGARLDRDLPAYFTVRTDTERALGIVSDNYQVVQNAEAFAFMDELLGRELFYETAGALFQGRRVWMLARLPESLSVDSEEEDLITRYLLLTNSHDGSRAINVIVTPVRVVCNNTLSAATDRFDEGIKIRHTGDVQGKIDEARRALSLASERFEALASIYRQLIEVKLSGQEIVEYFESVFPREDRTENYWNKQVGMLAVCYREGAGSELTTAKGTLWGAYNAIVDYVDHFRGSSNDEQRMNSTVWGSAMRVKNKALDTALRIVHGDDKGEA